MSLNSFSRIWKYEPFVNGFQFVGKVESQKCSADNDFTLNNGLTFSSNVDSKTFLLLLSDASDRFQKTDMLC